VNPLGTVPFFVDGAVEMTESTAICQYLVDCYRRHDFGLTPGHPEYAAYLNWLHQADATFTFPQTLYLRYHYLEPSEEKKAVGDDYARWFIARLRLLDEHLKGADYLVDGRFTIADIAVGFALFLGRVLKLDDRYQPQTLAYLDRLTDRPAFQRANGIGEPLQLPGL